MTIVHTLNFTLTQLVHALAKFDTLSIHVAH